MKRYKIKKFSQYIGISTDTIKHYQDCGILQPDIDPVNNYRYYNITHGERLIVSRRFRNLGFSINDTKDMISNKNGLEIQALLQRRYNEAEKELRLLKNNLDYLDYLINACDVFNHRADTFEICTRPGYYSYRHTFNKDFIEDDIDTKIAKELMDQLPNAFKLMIIPYTELQSCNKIEYYHTIAIKEEQSSLVEKKYLDAMHYIPPANTVRYIYSRPHSNQRFEHMREIYEKLKQDNFNIAKKDIYIENAIDFYQNGIRYENYFIYFPL